MKIDFSDKANIEDLRLKLGNTSDLEKFDAFLSKVDVFDFNNDQHVAEARKSCVSCCNRTPMDITIVIE